MLFYSFFLGSSLASCFRLFEISLLSLCSCCSPKVSMFSSFFLGLFFGNLFSSFGDKFAEFM